MVRLPIRLPIERRYFQMILVGYKKDEYRKHTLYWGTRFAHALGFQTMDELDAVLRKELDQQLEVKIQNGYSDRNPYIYATVTLSLGEGKPIWGAEPGVEYYRLHIQKMDTSALGCADYRPDNGVSPGFFDEIPIGEYAYTVKPYSPCKGNGSAECSRCIFHTSMWKDDVSCHIRDLAKYESVIHSITDVQNIPYAVGYVHSLYQDYRISEEEEEYLYGVADPEGLFNEPAEYDEEILESMTDGL